MKWIVLHLDSQEYEWQIDIHRNDMKDNRVLFLQYRKKEFKQSLPESPKDTE